MYTTILWRKKTVRRLITCLFRSQSLERSRRNLKFEKHCSISRRPMPSLSAEAPAAPPLPAAARAARCAGAAGSRFALLGPAGPWSYLFLAKLLPARNPWVLRGRCFGRGAGPTRIFPRVFTSDGLSCAEESRVESLFPASFHYWRTINLLCPDPLRGPRSAKKRRSCLPPRGGSALGRVPLRRPCSSSMWCPSCWSTGGFQDPCTAFCDMGRWDLMRGGAQGGTWALVSGSSASGAVAVDPPARAGAPGGSGAPKLEGPFPSITRVSCSFLRGNSMNRSWFSLLRTLLARGRRTADSGSTRSQTDGAYLAYS